MHNLYRYVHDRDTSVGRTRLNVVSVAGCRYGQCPSKNLINPGHPQGKVTQTNISTCQTYHREAKVTHASLPHIVIFLYTEGRKYTVSSSSRLLSPPSTHLLPKRRLRLIQSLAKIIGRHMSPMPRCDIVIEHTWRGASISCRLQSPSATRI